MEQPGPGTLPWVMLSGVLWGMLTPWHGPERDKELGGSPAAPAQPLCPQMLSKRRPLRP